MNKRAILITPKLGFCYGMTGEVFFDIRYNNLWFYPDGEKNPISVREEDLYFPAG